MSLTAIVRALVAAGATPAMIAAAVEAAETERLAAEQDRSTRKRTGNAERQRRFRDRRNADNALRDVTERYERDDAPSLEEKREVSPCTPSREKTQLSPRSPSLRSDDPSVMRERELFADQVDEAPAREKSDFPPDAFDRWWQKCPHKVGKDGAKRKFDVIRRTRRATFAELMDGLARYMATKPPDRPWCNPETWLNQGRWADEPAPEPRGDRRNAEGPGPHRPAASGGHDAIRAGFASVLGERLGGDPRGMASARRGDPVR